MNQFCFFNYQRVFFNVSNSFCNYFSPSLVNLSRTFYNYPISFQISAQFGISFSSAIFSMSFFIYSVCFLSSYAEKFIYQPSFIFQIYFFSYSKKNIRPSGISQLLFYNSSNFFLIFYNYFSIQASFAGCLCDALFSISFFILYNTSLNSFVLLYSMLSGFFNPLQLILSPFMGELSCYLEPWANIALRDVKMINKRAITASTIRILLALSINADFKEVFLLSSLIILMTSLLCQI